MGRRFQRDGYAAAIDKVRAQHRMDIPSAKNTMECPKCGTVQVVADTPGMRVCVKCSFEFRPKTVYS